MQMIQAVYRPATSIDADGDGEPDARDVGRPAQDPRVAQNAYTLLRSFQRLPGLRDDASVDKEVLRSWVTRVLQLADDSDRRAVAELNVGELLANAPSDADGAWPCEPVRDLLEELQNPKIESGFRTAVFNSRGVTTRALDEGGVQERDLAERYRGFAERVSDGWPRTAAVLRALATEYEVDARREEREAERFRRGLGR